MNKKLVIAAVALIAVVGILLGVWFATRPKAVEGEKTISVTVVHKDGSEEKFTYTTDAQTLGEVLYGEGLIQNQSADEGMFDTVAGEKADWSVDQGWWALYEGDAQANEGVDTLVIQDGDSFRLVYTVGFG